jgi:4-hydroxy-tetrahydrodipicolinate synthase
MEKTLFGIHAPTVTAMNEAMEVDEARTRAYNNFLIDNGVCCLVPSANNGECPHFSNEERIRVWKITVDVARQRHTMAFPSITANSTRDCIELAKCAESIGADGIMIGPPFYFRVTEEELREHFLAVARAISIPIMIHNEPSVFKLDVTPALMAKLNADSQGKIRLIKESTDNTQRVHEIINLCGDKVTVVVAGGGTALESLLLGAKAWMTGLINFLPAQSRKLFDFAKQGDYAAAREVYYQSILPAHYLLSEIRKPVATVKYALDVLGYKVGSTRPPLLPLKAADQEKVKRMLKEIGVL